ncbi:N5-glutamine S-adenosyl-L-methionine-dependent methyltransferase [Neisseria zoodegmatis]|uniref:Ribosomal protein uL3 glutamine methyltransferase n=1 Tax=Neisseria zoodegmatis TaxID=326523 RepID=A0AB38DTE8_9NEIS|nr:N5-glutamine S-adenosyl-L-methionine-dependent methyltransferase [Neisseria zoodegmatis]
MPSENGSPPARIHDDFYIECNDMIFSQAAEQLSTVRDILRFAVSRFNEAGLHFGHGSDNAHDEAAYLILHTLNLPLDILDPYLDAKLLDSEKEEVLGLIEKRVVERLPVAYLTNQAWQGDFDFYVDERVIVPRSFIYELLGEPLAPWIEHDELVHRALDLCTGSGCLAIQMAYHYPDAEIDAVDLSLDALEVAAINVEDYGLEERINLIHTDLFEGLEGTYDLIVSNPPYVDAESVEALPEEYLHEPELALGSGSDGLDATREIILNAAKFLNPKGVLLVEIGHNRDVLEAAYPELPFTWLETSGGDGFVFLLTREQLLGEE